MEKLWRNFRAGYKSVSGRIPLVILRRQTEKIVRILATKRVNHKPVIIDDKEFKASLQKAVEELGGW